ncbi:MAG TPA: serine/threonine-protein kinase [Thermoanaerobaculia bacterium]|nr:serine/threonine-protein kinase [Thermoanaerobaculia bacterium]
MELIGRQFGHIRVTEVVGEGGMGAVYAGYDEKLDRKVALKVLHADQRLDEEARERLLREARALSKVDHPNICRIHDYIETGDVDLLVLEYIDGRTLQRAIEDGLAHSEKFRIARAVAEVLVRAHRAGIVHRDLKPENVMLTRSGEVKVLDFGLARWLQRGRRSDSHATPASAAPETLPPQPAPPQPVLRVRADGDVPIIAAETMALPAVRPTAVSARREFLATAVGITLGTPLYMSPEQARGETLTPASDMFSFGLLLQVLFTGREPHPDMITAREVILRVARGETNPIEGARKDVAALINSLKQFAPADRPTAVQTVERLRFLIETPQRVARRAIAGTIVVIMLFGVWRYLVDLKFEQSRAVAAQLEAERQRAKAEDMIEFMLGDLRKKLEPVGKLDILDDVAGRALVYVDEIKPEVSGASELARNSKALNQLVEVRIAQGNLKDALGLANRSLRLTYLAMEKRPEDPEVQLAFGTSQFWLGNVYWRMGDNQNALVRWQSYLQVAERLAKQYPTNETYRLERAYGHSNLATVFEAMGDYDTALEQQKLTLRVKEERVAASRADPQRRAELAVTLNKVAWVQHRLGQLRDAHAGFQRELGIYQQLAAADPRNQTWKDRLSRSHSYVGRSLEVLGDVAGAERHIRTSLALQTRLHELDPANTNWTRNLALNHNQLSALRRTAGDFPSALAEVGKGEELMTSLITADPQRATWRVERGHIRLSRARALLAAGRAPEAAGALEAARRDFDPTATGTAAEAARAAAGLLEGDIFAARGNAAAAKAAWEAALATFAALPARGTDPSIRGLHAATLLRLGREGEASMLTAQLASAGYRHPEYLAEIGTTK